MDLKLSEQKAKMMTIISPTYDLFFVKDLHLSPI